MLAADDVRHLFADDVAAAATWRDHFLVEYKSVGTYVPDLKPRLAFNFFP